MSLTAVFLSASASRPIFASPISSSSCCSPAGSYRLCLTYHLCISASLTVSLPLLVTVCLSLSLTLLPSLSCPGRARPGAWGDRQARRLLLAFHPRWQQAQLGCRSGILQPPCSSHQAQPPPASPPGTFCPEQAVLGAGGQGACSCPAPVTGQPVLVALLPTSAAPKPPLLALGLDLLEWGPPPARPRLRNPAPAKASVWSSLSPDGPRTFSLVDLPAPWPEHLLSCLTPALMHLHSDLCPSQSYIFICLGFSFFGFATWHVGS